MTPRAIRLYECLAADQPDDAITSELSNQLTNSAATKITNVSPPRSSKQHRPNRPGQVRSPQIRVKGLGTAALSFDDHVAYTEPQVRPVLHDLRTRILALGSRVEEKVTPAQRIAYSVARVFAEVKVQKKRILVRVFDMGMPDVREIVTDIPGKHKWQHQKEIAIDSLELVDDAVKFIEASYKSSLTKSPPVRF
jgi:predicted transport protein